MPLLKPKPNRSHYLHRPQCVNSFLYREGSCIVGNIVLAVEDVVPANFEVKLRLLDGKLIASIHKEVGLSLVAIVFRRQADGLIFRQKSERLAKMPPIGDITSFLAINKGIQPVVIQRVIHIEPVRCLEHHRWRKAEGQVLHVHQRSIDPGYTVRVQKIAFQANGGADGREIFFHAAAQGLIETVVGHGDDLQGADTSFAHLISVHLS